MYDQQSWMVWLNVQRDKKTAQPLSLMKSTLLCHEHVWPFSIYDVNDSESSLIRFAIVSLPSGNAFYRHASCVPDILRQFFQSPALASQFHLCTWPRQLFLRDPVSTYCCTATGSRSPLPGVDFQRGGGGCSFWRILSTTLPGCFATWKR